jgi:hypothetical protein
MQLSHFVGLHDLISKITMAKKHKGVMKSNASSFF